MKKRKPNLKKERIWEIDVLRGMLILCILILHLYETVAAFCINGYYNINSYDFVNLTDPLHFWFSWGADGVIYKAFLTPEIIEIWKGLGVSCLFVLSGISINFSKNRLTGLFRLLGGAAFISIFTKLLVLYTGDEHQFIRFGALHCYAVCHLIHYFLLDGRSDKLLLAIAVVSILAGYYLEFHPVYSNHALLVPFGINERGAIIRDYWPIFPMLGWFLIGILKGKCQYPEKKTRFPKQEKWKWHKPIQFLGRHSGLIYCGHMVIYTILFCGIGYLFDLY